MADWITFFDSDHAIYVNARHKNVHAVITGDGMLAHIRDGDRVLDYGCGEAAYAGRLKQAELEALMKRHFAFRELRNLYDPGAAIFQYVREWAVVPLGRPYLTITEWEALWGAGKTGSRVAPVRFERDDWQDRLAKDPHQVKATDFRLRAGSSGKGEGEGGRDLGADVDLVGPGAAYERWRQTPEYREWLEMTGQRKKK